MATERTWAERVITTEAKAVAGLAGQINHHFHAAVDALEACTRTGGTVLVTGLGKSGRVHHDKWHSKIGRLARDFDCRLTRNSNKHDIWYDRQIAQCGERFRTLHDPSFKRDRKGPTSERLRKMLEVKPTHLGRIIRCPNESNACRSKQCPESDAGLAIVFEHVFHFSPLSRRADCRVVPPRVVQLWSPQGLG